MTRAVRIASLSCFLALLLITGCGPNDAGSTIEVVSPEDTGGVEPDSVGGDTGVDPGDGVIPGDGTEPPLDGVEPGDVVDPGDGVVPPEDGVVPPEDGVEPPEDTGDPTVKVSTYANNGSTLAGGSLDFFCKVEGLQDGVVSTFSLDVDGPGNTNVEELGVTFTKAGIYEIACRADWEGGWAKDATPLYIEVLPGEVAAAETALSASTVQAGATVWVTCTFTDSWGNPVDAAAKVITDPQIGLQIIGLKLLAKQSGNYQVACMEPLSGTVDQTPAALTVTAGLPKKILTTLTQDTIDAGQYTTVSCEAQDALGNAVPAGDFKIAVFVSPGLSLQGFQITGEKVGIYQVICVPQEESWDFFVLTPRTLTINHGVASGVDLVAIPDKPVYKMFEMVSFNVTAVDAYGNPIEGVPLTDLTFSPWDAGIEEVADMTYMLGMEGIWEFTVCLQENQIVCDTEAIPVDGYGPVINIKYPGRGATLMGKPSVVVTGSVYDPVSGIAAFRINGDSVYVDEQGNFSYPILSKQGMNLIVAVAEDPNGFKTLLVQSYYYSPIWYPMDINDPDASRVADSVMFFIWEQFFEDYDHSAPPNDISTFIEMMVGNLDLGSFIPNPVAEAGPYKVYLGNVTYHYPEVSVTIGDDSVAAQIYIWGTNIPIEAKGSCKVLFIDLCPDVSGEIDIDTLGFLFGMDLSIVNNQITATVTESQVVLQGINVSIDGIIGWLVGWIVDWAVTKYSDMLNDMVQDMIDEQIQALVLGFLGQLDLSKQLDIPNPLNPTAPPMTIYLDTVIEDLTLAMTGAYVELAGTVLAGKNINKNSLGSIGRASCLAWVEETFQWDTQQFAQIGIHDDLINQILFSVWWGGLLDMVVPLESFIDPDTLELEGIGTLEDLGITNIVATTEFYLPPIITSCNDAEALTLEVGDIYVELNMNMLNEPVTVGVFASLAAAAAIDIVQLPNGNQEFSLGIGDIDPLVVQVSYISDNLAGAEGFMTMIVQAILLPTLLDGLMEGTLASFELPEIDISGLSDMLPGGWVLKFVIEEFYRVDGYTTIEAELVPVQ